MKEYIMTKNNTPMRRFTFDMPEDLYNALRRRAFDTEGTMKEVAVTALEKELKELIKREVTNERDL